MERNLVDIVKGAIAGIFFVGVIGSITYYSKNQEKKSEIKKIKNEKYEYHLRERIDKRYHYSQFIH